MRSKPYICSCGFQWDDLPRRAKFHYDGGSGFEGYYWECATCGSTLFVPSGPLIEEGLT